MSEREPGEFIFDIMRRKAEFLGIAKDDEIWPRVDAETRQTMGEVESAIRADERARVWGEAAKVASDFGDKWAIKATRQRTEHGVAVCESAGSAGHEIATIIRAKIGAEHG